MDKFLEKYNLLKLLQEQTGNYSQKDLKKIKATSWASDSQFPSAQISC